MRGLLLMRDGGLSPPERSCRVRVRAVEPRWSSPSRRSTCAPGGATPAVMSSRSSKGPRPRCPLPPSPKGSRPRRPPLRRDRSSSAMNAARPYRCGRVGTVRSRPGARNASRRRSTCRAGRRKRRKRSGPPAAGPRRDRAVPGGGRAVSAAPRCGSPRTKRAFWSESARPAGTGSRCHRGPGAAAREDGSAGAGDRRVGRTATAGAARDGGAVRGAGTGGLGNSVHAPSGRTTTRDGPGRDDAAVARWSRRAVPPGARGGYPAGGFATLTEWMPGNWNGRSCQLRPASGLTNS